MPPLSRGRLVAAVERKSLPDLLTSFTGGRLFCDTRTLAEEYMYRYLAAAAAWAATEPAALDRLGVPMLG